ncbi:MarR family winged helix-turn-helix transcriptional regulator [Erythrobacter ani]|uniref:Winged helix-turn-helix transcriptional regulator n=1 Tax=Erythrobacter ani TaxID=2827235 RepID=A0ABS6SP22_9SPHN|nr:MarR family winged helix-turn-helix transcriptional regulator [Erythrobacter ani]MBV7266745.1 winged helix-turn-helix transcriptional regulator [Erythrobacter ani]
MNYLEQPPEGLGTLLRSLLGRLDPVVEEIYAETVPGMRSRYYPVMRALLTAESAPIGDLAKSAGVSQPAMTQTVTQMIAAGFIEHVESEDRRCRTVALSAAGVSAAQTLRPLWAAVAKAADDLGAELPVPLARVLRQSLAALERRDFRTRIEDARKEAER